jgi:hypothetical protein
MRPPAGRAPSPVVPNRANAVGSAVIQAGKYLCAPSLGWRSGVGEVGMSRLTTMFPAPNSQASCWDVNRSRRNGRGGQHVDPNWDKAGVRAL